MVGSSPRSNPNGALPKKRQCASRRTAPRYAFIGKHRGMWRTRVMCQALAVSRDGFDEWMRRPAPNRSQVDRQPVVQNRSSFERSDRTCGSRRVWRDLRALGARSRSSSRETAPCLPNGFGHDRPRGCPRESVTKKIRWSLGPEVAGAAAFIPAPSIYVARVELTRRLTSEIGARKKRAR